ncbi:methylated-DNA--[protein]-cysteine S-methyltransferase [Stenotrophomonas sp. SI-NJAU-1]|uniref:methylated-DNA--[protein]-cysteine S-methyltransferase n=1 Tax=Stenotrophomonas TaxID=40323 RepID=UPI001E50129D|nr:MULTISPECIES: methylated-DNA--[protein]-cysteine S-methyltransferase [Stenotrophomonas]MDT9579917.1 methylated-DNA--[protein]-cysteine S-methyltransferase [Stenotrophomonas indicatrix]UEX17046.1 methylated-DNA--[protein]-cysteine S-methyltransferase [Stenotrophomonas sp. SI-NJAU-1]
MDSTADIDLDARIERVCRHLQASVDEPSLQELADIAGCSPTRLHRLFKQATGVTPKQYATALRADRLREGLQRQDRITDAFHEAGFGSSGRFYENAPRLLGMTPKRWRAGGGGEVIRFAIAQSTLGSVLVASSSTGVVAILLGDDPEALLYSLQQRFRQAELVGADRGYEHLIAQVIGLIEEPARGTTLPLDIRGTAFQQRVWQALQRIPHGQTASYADIAARIGAPRASRAVARACASNPLAVAVPCHRVVRRDGDLSGYAWGVERKRELLRREKMTRR